LRFPEEAQVTRIHSTASVARKDKRNMGDFIGSFWFFVIMVVILIGLGGLWYYLHNKADED
jgi:hypothetical protein